MPKQTRRRQRGGVYKKLKPMRTIKQRPVGFELPRKESRFEYVRRYAPQQNGENITMNTVINAAMKTTRSKKPKIQINLKKNIIVRKDTTYQYLRNILQILKQIVKDSKRSQNIDSEHYDTLVDMASEISQVLPKIKSDLGINSNSNSNNNMNNLNADDLFDDVEEVIEIIRSYIHQYDRVLRKGKMTAIERIEAEMELIAVSIDEAIQNAKTRYMAEPVDSSVNDLAAMFNTFKPFGM